jgi:putative ABC transport system substrate-binding protein
MTIDIGRRQFISALGGAAAAWPLAVRAQQPTMPVIGYLRSDSPDASPKLRLEFIKGLNETGYVDGRNVAIEYRWAEGQQDRLPALAADLAALKVDVIAASGGPQPASAAMRATTAIPIVTAAAGNFVEHFNRPEGNLTGVSLLASHLTPKRLELLVELMPGAPVAVLANPSYSEYEPDRKAVEDAARVLGAEFRFVTASADADLEPAFASVAKSGVSTLLISADPFFNSRRDRLVALAARYAVPTMHEWRRVS